MANEQITQRLRALPAVGDLIQHPALAELAANLPRSLVVAALRASIDAARDRVLAGEDAEIAPEQIVAETQRRATAAATPNLRRVINATGVVVHTNLGRSPLADEAIKAIVTAARGYSNLEFDLAAGKRGSRSSLVEDILCELTGAEAALVVNNNAGAVLLTLAALAHGREVIVSRGELIEIGGSFRVPDVMSQSGARLVEVGTTNRTHLRDYETAIGEHAAALMKVHASNYHVVGFTASVSGAELAQLAHERGILAFEDLGSGSLLDSAELGLPHEPTAREAVAQGLDLVTFSGDKLLGGPQAGIIVGKAEHVRTVAKHPLHRALRIDKLNLAALEATLRLYRDSDIAMRRIPTLRMLSRRAATLRGRAQRVARRLKQALGKRAKIAVVQSKGQVGGGALPFAELAGPVVTITTPHLSADALATRLRALPVPIIVRIERDRVVVDLRTVLEHDTRDLQRGLVGVIKGEDGP